MPQDRIRPDILLALGSNLASPAGSPAATMAAALGVLAGEGVKAPLRSRLWRTRPVPDDGQPWFLNAVAALETDLAPAALLALLLRVEAGFGRVRERVNGPRTLDLDLIAYGDRVRTGPEPPLLPHPRMSGRAFVLLPLRDAAPGWRHPRTHLDVGEMIAALPAGDVESSEPAPDESGWKSAMALGK